MTPEQRKARREGRLDQRCRDCGATQAASSWCCQCGGRALEYREHVRGEVQWCQKRSGAAVYVPKNPRGPRGRKQEPPQKAVAAVGATDDKGEPVLWGSTQ